MNKPFSSWDQGAPYYVPSILIGLAIAVVAWPAPWAYAGVVILGLGVFTLFFFRDPPRAITAEPNEMVAPADGKVVAIEDLEESPHYEGPCRRVSIFLSLFNVHINRAPVAGTIRDMYYKPGEFKAAMRAETTDCNESNTILMDTDYGPITVRQISGLVARRIVCIPEIGASLKQGEKFGMIKFGSRTELYAPPGTEVCVSVGQNVSAGSTIMARSK